MSLPALQESPALAARIVPENAGWALPLLARRDVRLGIVLVACLIPRAIAAWRLPAACDDAYYYLHMADSLEHGRFARALQYLNINIYPLLLIALHRLGLDWIVAAKIWGVLTGTALVFPLFDWLRRMFDERIALLGIFLYAVHPTIIEPTVEPLRESTFWLLFVLSLDLFWRAASERRWWQFAAGGLSLALALHTRLEAWFLLVPLGGWMAASWWRNRAARWRLVAGTVLCLAVTPLFVLLVNVTLLAHHSQWELGRMSPFLLVVKWVQGPTHDPVAPAPVSTGGPTATAAAPTAATPPQADPSAGATAISHAPTPRVYFHEMLRMLGVVFLALTIVGFARGRRELRNPDKAVLALLTLGILLAIWVRLRETASMNGRYFLVLILIDAPFAAIGSQVVIRRLGWFGLDRGIAWLRPGRAAVVFAACLLAAGWAQALTTHHSHRQLQARLGKWIDREAGQFHSVVADFDSIRPAYFAGRGMPDVLTFDEFYESRIDHSPPDLAIFHPASFREELLPYLVQRAARLGLKPLDQAAFSPAKPEFIIFVRNRS